MIVRNVDLDYLESALSSVNMNLGSGVVFKHPPKLLKGKTRDWKVTLASKHPETDYRLLKDIYSGERTSQVCYHVVKRFVRALPAGVRTVWQGRTFTPYDMPVIRYFVQGIHNFTIRRRCSCEEPHAFTPLRERLLMNGMSVKDIEAVDKLKVKERMKEACRFIVMVKMKSKFKVDAQQIENEFKDYVDMPEDLCMMTLPVLERWDTDVLERFAASRTRYNAIGG